MNKQNTVTTETFNLSVATLHILAMTLMLMDHLWATLLPAQEWLTCAGRVAFPIFAFMTVEGYFHTHSLKKYMLRLLAFALISEIPFDLMYGGTWLYPFHQNVFLYVITVVLVVAVGAILSILVSLQNLKAITEWYKNVY